MPEGAKIGDAYVEVVPQLSRTGQVTLEKQLQSTIGLAANRLGVDLGKSIARASDDLLKDVGKNMSGLQSQMSNAGATAGKSFSESFERNAGGGKLFNGAIKDSARFFSDFGTRIGIASFQVQMFGQSLTKAFTLPAIAGIGAFTKVGLDFAVNIDKATAALKALLPAGSDVEALVKRLNQLALDSAAFNADDVVKYSKSLIGAGVSMHDTEVLMKALSNIFGTFAVTGNEAGLAMLGVSQIFQKGKVQGEELTKQISQQLPIWKLLAEGMGVTEAQLTKMVKNGQVSSEDFAQAMIKIGNTKQFVDGASNSLTTLSGAWQVFKEKMSVGIGTAFLENKDAIIAALHNFEDALTPVVDYLISKLPSALNGMADFTAKVAEMAKAFELLTPEQKDKILGIAAALAALGPAMVAISKVGTGVSLLGQISAMVLQLAAAGPVGVGLLAIAAGLTAIGGAFIYAYTHSEEFRKSINEGFAEAKRVVEEDLLPAFESLKKAVDDLIKSLGVDESAMGFLGKLVSAEFVANLKALATAINIAAAETKAWADAINAGKDAWEFLMNLGNSDTQKGKFGLGSFITTPEEDIAAVKGIIETIKGLWNEFWAWFTTASGDLWGKFLSAAIDTYDKIKALFSFNSNNASGGLLSGLFDIDFSPLVQKAKDAIDQVKKAFIDGSAGLWSAVISAWVTEWSRVGQPFYDLAEDLGYRFARTLERQLLSYTGVRSFTARVKEEFETGFGNLIEDVSVGLLLSVDKLWDEIAKSAAQLWTDIKSSWAKEVFDFGKIESDFKSMWDRVSAAASTTAKAVAGFFNALDFSPLTTAWNTFWTNAKKIASDAWNIIVGYFGFDTTRIAAGWKQLWDDLVNIAKTAIENIVKLFEKLFDPSVIKAAWSALWDDLKAVATRAWDDMKKLFVDLFDVEKIKGVWNSLWTELKAVAKTAWDEIKKVFNWTEILPKPGDLPGGGVIDDLKKMLGFGDGGGGGSLGDSVLGQFKDQFGPAATSELLAGIQGMVDEGKTKLGELPAYLSGQFATDIAAGLATVTSSATTFVTTLETSFVEPVKALFDAIVAHITGVIQVGWDAAFTALMTTVTTFLTNITAVFGPGVGVELLLTTFMAFLTGTIQVAWDAFFAALTLTFTTWKTTFETIWTEITVFLSTVVLVAFQAFQLALDPIWLAITAAVTALKTNIITIFGEITTGVSAQITNLINFLNKAIETVNKILPKNLKIAPIPALKLAGGGQVKGDAPSPVKAAGGGSVFGPGTRTSDSIPAMLSDGEFVIRADAARNIGYDYLNIMNRKGIIPDSLSNRELKGWGGGPGHPRPGFAQGGQMTVPPPDSKWLQASKWKSQISKGFAVGGAVGGGGKSSGNTMGDTMNRVELAMQRLHESAGTPYVFGAVGPASYDCTGLVGMVYNTLLGREPPYTRVFTTDTMSFFTPGHGMFTVGYANAGEMGASADMGHAAGNLAGLAHESRGGDGTVIGAGATSVDSFARQGYLPEIGGKFTSAGGNQGVAGLAVMAQQVMDDAFKGLKKFIPEADGSMWNTILNSTFTGISEAAKEYVLGKIPFREIGGGTGWQNPFGGQANQGQIDAWIKEAIAIAGVPEDWLGPYRTLIFRESGGNPSAQSFSSNGPLGYAIGLAQVLQSTFDTYRNSSLPNDRTHPVANLVASMNYVRDRYGDIHNVDHAVGPVPNPGGYDEGGFLNDGQMAWNTSGKPEMVLNPQQSNALLNNIDAAATGPSGTQIYGDIYINGVKQPAATVEIRENNAKLALALQRGSK